MRFRKSIKLFPGVKINLSKTGISTSVGPKGATVNITPGRKTRLTTGLPGTGLSHTETLGATERPPRDAHTFAAIDLPPPPLWLSVIRAIWNAVKIIGVVAIGIFIGIAAFLAIGGSSKKRR